MRFSTREEAATLLAARLMPYHNQHPLVLGVPRGAVPMAAILADALGGDLDVVLVRKLRAEGYPEFAIGAIDETGTVYEGPHYAQASAAYLAAETAEQRQILQRRRQLYTQARPPLDPKGRVVILVDDGVATGASMLSAIGLARTKGARKVVVAVGVAPSDAVARLRAAADEVVCLAMPEPFFAVGEFYDDFSEVTDDMVVATLEKAGARARAL